MKAITALTLASALAIAVSGAAFAQSTAPQTGQNQGGFNDKNASPKADHIDKGQSASPRPSTATTGAAVHAADQAAGQSKDKGGSAMPSNNENAQENKAGRQ